MFETSFLLFLEYLLLNIFVPFIPGLLFLWIFYGDKFRGFLLYLLSRFVGVGVVAFSLFNMQFIHFGVGVREYLIILGVLLGIFALKIYIKKQSLQGYIKTLKLKNIIPEMKKSFKKLSLTEKVFTVILFLFSIYFVGITGIYNFNLPTYGWDSFWNRNRPAFNIFYDGGVKLFGNEDEILGRGRLGYPIQIPVYKALISQIAGGINDIYFNTWQRLVFLLGLLFIFLITFNKTKNIFKSILPIGLILSLPLVFFHAYEGYMDVPLVMFCMISIRLFYQYLETKDFDYISLGFLFGFLLSYIKNDGFVVFFPGVLMSFVLILLIKKFLIYTIRGLFNDKENIQKIILYIMYFFLPFLIIKIVHGLGFNQAANIRSGIGVSNIIHREIFGKFPQIFINLDNYNLVLIFLLFIAVYPFMKNKINYNNVLFLCAGLFIFLILIAVFLFTENYQRVLDQTTVNRSFTMVFMILLGFSGFLLNEE